jgi:hypothetical protein
MDLLGVFDIDYEFCPIKTNGWLVGIPEFEWKHRGQQDSDDSPHFPNPCQL